MKQELQGKKEKAVKETPARAGQKDISIYAPAGKGQSGDGKAMIAIVSSGRRACGILLDKCQFLEIGYQGCSQKNLRSYDRL